MNLTRFSMRGALIVALMLTMTAGCASTPKPVKCDRRLEPINKPALPANMVPVATCGNAVADCCH
jgi:starvation-inducible outer membrane lipoprotein